MNITHIHSLPEQWQSIASIFVALGDAQRQRLLLAFEPGERLTASQLCEASPLGRTTVLHHLKILRASGVLLSEKIGKEVFYRVDREAVTAALTDVMDFLNAPPKDPAG